KVLNDTVRYAGSILKYSISEEHHKKGYYVVELDAEGNVTTEKRWLTPVKDMRTVEATMEELLTHPVNEDYVFVRLLDETPILLSVYNVRSNYPNTMHVERKMYAGGIIIYSKHTGQNEIQHMSHFKLFK